MNKIVNAIINNKRYPKFLTYKTFEKEGISYDEFFESMMEGMMEGYIDNVYNDIFSLNIDYSYKVIPMGLLAKMIDPDSYVSMNHVLCDYNWIPEMIFAITSVTKGESRTVEAGRYGTYIFRNIYDNEQKAGIINKKDFEGCYRAAKPLRALCDVLEYRKEPIYDLEDAYDVLRVDKFNVKKDVKKKDFNELQGAFEDEYIEIFLNNLRKDLNL